MTQGNSSGATLARVLSVGEVADGHRSHARAAALLPELKSAFGLPTGAAPDLDPALTGFIADVILGAAWYTRKYRGARCSALAFIALNVVLVLALPVGIAALGKYWSSSPSVSASQYSFLIAQLSAVLCGIFALQKTLSAWYAQQQNYAGWYKCGADLKEIYYGLVQKWNGRIDGNGAPFLADLGDARDRSRHIMEAERIDYYTRLALPSFDVLDMFTASRANVTSLVSALVPAAKSTAAVAIGTKVIKGALSGDTGSQEIAAALDKPIPLDFNDTALIAATTTSVPDFDETVVAACAGISLKNASDILTQCCAGHSTFFSWYNATFRNVPAIANTKHYPSTDADMKNTRFKNFWDQIPIVFDRPQINAIEFCALTAINIEETDGDLSAAPEGMWPLNKPHGGLAYAFDRIPETHKLSYNKSDLGRDALSLFKDQIFVTAHRARAGSDKILNRPGGIDPRWAGDVWPADVSANPVVNINGFVMQADFYKFRGRGVIQTTWRNDYKPLIEYILSDKVAANANLSQLAAHWKAAAPGGLSGGSLIDAIATLSTNEDWDSAFGEDILLAKALEIDSVNKSRYLNSLATDFNVLNADNRTKGSLLYFAAHINGPAYQARVQPMMKALMCGVAGTVQGPAVARAPRNPDLPAA